MSNHTRRRPKTREPAGGVSQDSDLRFAPIDEDYSPGEAVAWSAHDWPWVTWQVTPDSQIFAFP